MKFFWRTKCWHCGKVFAAHSRGHHYCTAACRQAAYRGRCKQLKLELRWPEPVIIVKGKPLP